KIRLTPLTIKASILFIFLVTVASCKKAQKEPETPEKLYTIYCASCHIAPDIDDLPKHIWENNVLPEMGARLGIRDNGFNPYKDLNLQEYEARLKSGIFPPRENPLITQENWDKLKEYIISTAPDSLVLDHNTLSEIKDLHQFKTKPVRLNPHRKSALMTVYL